jgi:hypothetical protein
MVVVPALRGVRRPAASIVATSGLSVFHDVGIASLMRSPFANRTVTEYVAVDPRKTTSAPTMEIPRAAGVGDDGAFVFPPPHTTASAAAILSVRNADFRMSSFG